MVGGCRKVIKIASEEQIFRFKQFNFFFFVTGTDICNGNYVKSMSSNVIHLST